MYSLHTIHAICIYVYAYVYDTYGVYVYVYVYRNMYVRIYVHLICKMRYSHFSFRPVNHSEDLLLRNVGDESTDQNNNITMTSEDLLQPGHVVKERWKVVSLSYRFLVCAYSLGIIRMILNPKIT